METDILGRRQVIKTNNMIKYFLIFPALLLFSCSDMINKNEIVGNYDWNNSQKGQLTIDPDMTYTYYFDLSKNDTLQNTGTWIIDTIKNEIQFHDFKFSFVESKKGVWISRVRRKNGVIQLIYASDNNIYLRKIE